MFALSTSRSQTRPYTALRRYTIKNMSSKIPPGLSAIFFLIAGVRSFAQGSWSLTSCVGFSLPALAVTYFVTE